MSEENKDIFDDAIAQATEEAKKSVQEKTQVEIPESIEELTWEQVKEKFKGELTSRFVFELSKLKGDRFISTYLRFAEYVLPKIQRKEGDDNTEGSDKLEVVINKQVDQRTIVINDILDAHGVDLNKLNHLKDSKDEGR